MLRRLISAALLSLFASQCFAGDTILWRGRADFGSCNRIKYYKDDFGITWPTNESVGQDITAEIYLARTVDEVIKNRLISCAAAGVLAAGATSLATSGAGAWPAFRGAFDACLTSQGLTQFISDNISIRTQTRCHW
jgi:hypothetical protein